MQLIYLCRRKSTDVIQLLCNPASYFISRHDNVGILSVYGVSQQHVGCQFDVLRCGLVMEIWLMIARDVFALCGPVYGASCIMVELHFIIR